MTKIDASPSTRIGYIDGVPTRVQSTLRADAARYTNTGRRAEHSCVFCDWNGSYADYYAHWRINHRRRSGYTRTEIPAHA